MRGKLRLARTWLGLMVEGETKEMSGVSSMVVARFRFVVGRVGSADSRLRKVWAPRRVVLREGSSPGVEAVEVASSIAVAGVAGGSGLILRMEFCKVSIDNSSVWEMME